MVWPRQALGALRRRAGAKCWKRSDRAEGGPEALARLCERYWPPLYGFVRYRGYDPEDAQDLVQGFFEHLIESRALATSTRRRGASAPFC